MATVAQALTPIMAKVGQIRDVNDGTIPDPVLRPHECLEFFKDSSNPTGAAGNSQEMLLVLQQNLAQLQQVYTDNPTFGACPFKGTEIVQDAMSGIVDVQEMTARRTRLARYLMMVKFAEVAALALDNQKKLVKVNTDLKSQAEQLKQAKADAQSANTVLASEAVDLKSAVTEANNKTANMSMDMQMLEKDLEEEKKAKATAEAKLVATSAGACILCFKNTVVASNPDTGFVCEACNECPVCHNCESSACLKTVFPVGKTCFRCVSARATTDARAKAGYLQPTFSGERALALAQRFPWAAELKKLREENPTLVNKAMVFVKYPLLPRYKKTVTGSDLSTLTSTIGALSRVSGASSSGFLGNEEMTTLKNTNVKAQRSHISFKKIFGVGKKKTIEDVEAKSLDEAEAIFKEMLLWYMNNIASFSAEDQEALRVTIYFLHELTFLISRQKDQLHSRTYKKSVELSKEQVDREACTAQMSTYLLIKKLVSETKNCTLLTTDDQALYSAVYESKALLAEVGLTRTSVLSVAQSAASSKTTVGDDRLRLMQSERDKARNQLRLSGIGLDGDGAGAAAGGPPGGGPPGARRKSSIFDQVAELQKNFNQTIKNEKYTQIKKLYLDSNIAEGDASNLQKDRRALADKAAKIDSGINMFYWDNLGGESDPRCRNCWGRDGSFQKHSMSKCNAKYALTCHRCGTVHDYWPKDCKPTKKRRTGD